MIDNNNNKQKDTANLDLKLIVEVINEHGELVERREQKSESFVANFLKVLYNQFIADNTSQPIKDTTGANHNLRFPTADSQSVPNFMSTLGDSAFGIQVGIGTTAASPSDYVVNSIVNNGTAVGQMAYSDVTTTTPVTAGAKSSCTFVRNFTNTSGGSIGVRELTMVARLYDSTPSTYNALMVRDVLSSNLGVPNNNTLTVTYEISVTT